MQKGWTTLLFLVVAVILEAAGPQKPDSQRGNNPWKTQWSYEGVNGPAHWGDLDSEYDTCKAGKQQSPIDIRIAKAAQLPTMRFEYKNGPLKVINNGHTAVRVDYAPGNGNLLIVGDKRYELRQFHFHRPSEEYICGKPYDMSIHFMHEANDGKVAAVAVLLKSGSENATIRQIWGYMPKTEGEEKEVAGVDVNPGGLLPHDAGYYTYNGSLTAPPCSEGVVWFVLKTPVDVSAEDINAFAKLYPHNVRPLRPLNGRVVLESQ